MIMFLHFIFLFNALIFTIIKCQTINSSHAISPVQNFQFSESLDRCNRTRREEDKLKQMSVCSGLDRTEETAFIVIISTKNYGRFLCMGSILDEYHVLTARNCFDKSDAATLRVIAGYESPYWGRNSQVKYVDKIIKHDKELAVVVLRNPFQFSETVKPIKIIGPEKMNDAFDASYPSPYQVIGFEVPRFLEQPAKISRTLSYHMKEEKFKKCKDDCYEFQKQGTEEDKKLYFCSDAAASFGWGGMGSPTLIPVQKEFVLIGVLWNYKCTVNVKKTQNSGQAENNENVHIRTDRFYKWIKANSHMNN